MKEMIYKQSREIEVLDKGEYAGRKYLTLSFGTHPAAYVSITEEEDKIAAATLECDYALDKYDSAVFDGIDVHGGFSFYGDRDGCGGDPGTIYIGRDYRHPGDFNGQDMLDWFISTKADHLIHWTTKEMVHEAKSVIEQLNGLEVFK